jgi:DNA polymerase I-like protein with 3'-5' exonuclease and polymerase domains
MILQVHDELVFDIPTHEKEVFENLVREVMEGVLQNSKFNEVYPVNKIQNSNSIQQVSEISDNLES